MTSEVTEPLRVIKTINEHLDNDCKHCLELVRSGLALTRRQNPDADVNNPGEGKAYERR